MAQLTWVRGNSVLLAVTLTQKKTDGTEEPIDLSVYDAWAVRVLRVSSYKRDEQDGVTAALNVDGHIILSISSTLPCGSYSVEVTMEKESSGGATDNGTAKRRSYELPVFRIVESNGESDVTYDVIEGMLSADIEMRFQLLPIAETLGKNAYELWKELPGNEGKTLQEYIDEVLSLDTITAACLAATTRAEAAADRVGYPDYIGEDNYVYHWNGTAYAKTNIYVKGDPGTTDYNDLENKPTIPTVPANVSAFANDAGYLTKHQDISGKEDRLAVAATTATALTAAISTYYCFTATVGTLAVTLPTVADTSHTASVVLYLTTSATPSVTFTSSHPVLYQEGFSLDASKTYEINCLFNGAAWVLMAAEINTSS